MALPPLKKLPDFCEYQFTGEKAVTSPGCRPDREFIAQEDYKFCPFCGRPIIPATLPDQPMLA